MERTGRPVRIILLVILALSLALVACHGYGHRAVVAPPVLTVTAGIPLADVVAIGTLNAYAVATTPGALYKISVTAAGDDVDLLYFASDSSFTSLAACTTVDNTRIEMPSSEDCITIAPGGVLYFAVDGSFLSRSSAGYTIAVEVVDETSVNQSTPLPDFVSPVGAHLYSVSTTSGTNAVAITGLDDDLNLYVMTGPSLTGQANCPNTEFAGTVPEDCMVIAGSGSVFFIVDGIFGSHTTENYTVLIAPAPDLPNPISEGSSAAPMPVSLNTPTIGQVASGATPTSYYSIGGLTPGQRYTVSITGLSDDADLSIFDNDASFSTRLSRTACPDTLFISTVPESCSLTVSGNTLYFAVKSEAVGSGAAYITLVTPGPP